MAFAVFGPGALFITRTDGAGPYTPVNIGYIQEFSYDEAGEEKELYGQNQYPLVTARGTIKATGKAKAAEISGIALNAAMWGGTFSAGQLIGVLNESHTIPSTPFQVTITPPSSGVFDTDLGVLNSTTGLPLTKVTSGPTTGQYSESAAVYTFAAADTGNTVLINYAYTLTTGGQTLVVTNQPIGANTTFQLDYFSELNNGNPYYARFFACVATKLTRAHKLTDFMMPEIDFSFYANAAGKVYETSFPQVG